MGLWAYWLVVEPRWFGCHSIGIILSRVEKKKSWQPPSSRSFKGHFPFWDKISPAPIYPNQLPWVKAFYFQRPKDPSSSWIPAPFRGKSLGTPCFAGPVSDPAEKGQTGRRFVSGLSRGGPSRATLSTGWGLAAGKGHEEHPRAFPPPRPQAGQIQAGVLSPTCAICALTAGNTGGETVNDYWAHGFV